VLSVVEIWAAAKYSICNCDAKEASVVLLFSRTRIDLAGESSERANTKVGKGSHVQSETDAAFHSRDIAGAS